MNTVEREFVNLIETNKIEEVNTKNWPESLQNINFGDDFNQPIENVKWPKSLKSITFGWHFNQNIPNLDENIKLIFAKLNDKFANNLPNNLLDLEIISVDKPLMNLPINLKKLYICGYPNKYSSFEEFISISQIPFGCKIG